MLRLFPVSLLLLISSLAHAVEDAEPPLEPNMLGVVLFFVVAIGCVVAYVWYTMKNEKASKEEKEGEKF